MFFGKSLYCSHCIISAIMWKSLYIYICQGAAKAITLVGNFLYSVKSCFTRLVMYIYTNSCVVDYWSVSFNFNLLIQGRVRSRATTGAQVRKKTLNSKVMAGISWLIARCIWRLCERTGTAFILFAFISGIGTRY